MTACLVSLPYTPLWVTPNAFCTSATARPRLPRRSSLAWRTTRTKCRTVPRASARWLAARPHGRRVSLVDSHAGGGWAAVNSRSQESCNGQCGGEGREPSGVAGDAVGHVEQMPANGGCAGGDVAARDRAAVHRGPEPGERSGQPGGPRLLAREP